MYLVYAFGFDLLDNTATDSETLTLYGVDSAPLGSVSLRSVRESQARQAGRAGAGRRSRETFLGIVSRGAPIGLASQMLHTDPSVPTSTREDAHSTVSR
mmetsp:Transcript_20707/g.66197  ORF Transcript_20707/g.66197 Transcript_20707/m.66197 type:complete len:99 (+) Transcript_20707:104-400(+)